MIVPSVAAPPDWGAVLRQDVVPVLSAYLVVLAMLWTYARHRRRDPAAAGGASGRRDRMHRGTAPPGRPGWGPLLRHVLLTAAGGYVLFLLIVAGYHVGLGQESSDLVDDALAEGSALCFGVVVPAFLLLTWLEERAARLRRRTAPRERSGGER